MTRGMLAMVLFNLENNPNTIITDAFMDVESGAWYAESVSWAASHGIVDGYGDGIFGAEDSITREQFVTMLWRYAGEPQATGSLNAFPDASDIQGWASDAMVWAVQNGIIEGTDGGRLDPRSNALRSQVATMFMRFCQNILK